MLSAIRHHPWRATIALVVFALAFPIYWLVWAWGTPGCEAANHDRFPKCFNDHEYPGATEDWKARGWKVSRDPEPPYWPF